MKNGYLFLPILFVFTSCYASPVILKPTPTQTRISSTSTPTPLSTPTLTRTLPPLTYSDNDRDGLSDLKENYIGTDTQNSDTDGDKISDYDEVTKYFLNPLLSDTDGDGILDSDPNERRENTYSLKAVMKIVRPFNTETMNDHFQDVTPISETDNNLTYEVVFYPNAHHIIEEIPWNQASNWYDGLDEFIQPDLLMNFDKEMSEETQRLFTTTNGTDLDIVRKMYRWQEMNVEMVNGDSEPFLNLIITKDEQIIFHKGGYIFSPKDHYTEWDLTHLVFGKESFYNRTHGSCGSIANFHSTILRSVGIPTRIIQTIPLVNEKSTHQVSLLENLSSDTLKKLGNQSGSHFLVEAFVGNRWVRINNERFEDHTDMGAGSFIKIIAFSSWKGVDFATSWSHHWPPMELIEISEQDAIHEPVPYDFQN